MKEIWRDIYFKDKGLIWDYRGQYQVSNKDDVSDEDLIRYFIKMIINKYE